MNEAKEILDRHLKAKNINTNHIHIAAYMSSLDAINEALTLHTNSNINKLQTTMKNRNLDHADHWATPPQFYNDLNKRFDFNFDPTPFQHDLDKFDGLLIEWKERNFINPPYSRTLKEAFVKKAISESKKGKLCVMLLPVSTSTILFHDHILPNATDIEFIRRRIPFIGTNTKGELVNWHLWDIIPPADTMCVKNSGMHDSMIVIFDGRDRTLTMHDAMASLPDISLMQAESIVLKKQSAIDVDCKINHTEIGLLFMEGYYHAKRKLEGNEP